MFVPEIVSTLRGYTRRQLLADLQAGVIVGIVASRWRSPSPSPAG
jgi:hypothetical protein